MIEENNLEQEKKIKREKVKEIRKNIGRRKK